MKHLLAVTGQSNSGPGERQEMLDRAHEYLTKSGVAAADVVRIDVPAKGGGEESDGPMRGDLEAMVPLLQSGSLFGDLSGLLLVDSQNLNLVEAKLTAELLEQAGDVAVALVCFGTLPASVAKVIKASGEVVAVRKMWERQAGEWLRAELTLRKMNMEPEAQSALLQRFGTDTAGLGQALDQLVEHQGKITPQAVLDRFRNRPDEPLVHYLDSVSSGKAGDALRRLADFLTHGHPLVLLAALESDLKRRALASSSETEEAFRSAIGARSDDRRAARLWRERGRIKDSSFQKALEALVRADRVMKTQPEEVHRVTLERLTVAFSRWYGGRG
ncbi:MAG: DNA polymerase III subunit delta [Acidimicrobiia bacterium]